MYVFFYVCVLVTLPVNVTIVVRMGEIRDFPHNSLSIKNWIRGFNVGFIERYICTRGFESRYEI